MVHPGLSWVDVDSAAVKVDRCLEIFHVAVASDSSFDRHDLAVHAFSNGIGSSVSTVAHDIH